MRSFILALVWISLSLSPVNGQATEKTKPKSPNEPVPGYHKQKMEGFTLVLSDKVSKADTQSFERKPLDVLELELRHIVKVMSGRAIKALQTVPIWVEWDDKDDKNPNVVAKYYGGNGLWVLEQGKNPLKANSIEVLTLKRLTMIHQPKSNFQQCVLLHEMAHAVHHQLFTFDDPLIKATYKQAMDRKLYDSVRDRNGRLTRAYAATNSREYFAELSCSYLDKGAYYPFNRQELKEHDPDGYKLMEIVWSKAESKSKPDKTAKTDKPHPATGPAEESTAKSAAAKSIPEDKEDEASRKLKLLLAAFEDGKVKGTERDRFLQSLEKLIAGYPATAAAKEAKALVEKLTEEEK